MSEMYAYRSHKTLTNNQSINQQQQTSKQTNKTK